MRDVRFAQHVLGTLSAEGHARLLAQVVEREAPRRLCASNEIRDMPDDNDFWRERVLDRTVVRVVPTVEACCCLLHASKIIATCTCETTCKTGMPGQCQKLKFGSDSIVEPAAVEAAVVEQVQMLALHIMMSSRGRAANKMQEGQAAAAA